MDCTHVLNFLEDITGRVLIADKEDFFSLTAQFASEIQSMVICERENVQIAPPERKTSYAVHQTRAESGHCGARRDIESEDLRHIKEELDRQKGKEGELCHISERIFSEKHSEDGKECLENGHECAFFHGRVAVPVEEEAEEIGCSACNDEKSFCCLRIQKQVGNQYHHDRTCRHYNYDEFHDDLLYVSLLAIFLGISLKVLFLTAA